MTQSERPEYFKRWMKIAKESAKRKRQKEAAEKLAAPAKKTISKFKKN